MCYSVQIIQIAEKINKQKNNMLIVNIANKDYLNQRVRHFDACNIPKLLEVFTFLCNHVIQPI